MDREKIYRYLQQHYSSKKDMISRIPLGVQPEVLWQELLDKRRSESTVLPLYRYNGASFWYVTTEKMIAASEKIIGMLIENENDFDPYTGIVPVLTLEETFYTSYVEGSQITMQSAMDFLTSGQLPREIEEQIIFNNRRAGNYASANLYRKIDAAFLRELVYILTDGMDNASQDFRLTDEVDFTPLEEETFAFPPFRSIPDRIEEYCEYLSLPNVHPLVKAAVAQAYILVLRPFPEGNERLGRILSNIILLRAGYTFFSDISFSALIARKNYAYYEAVANILRQENGGDMTYFIEYYLELLSRAVDEIRFRQEQKAEQTIKAEKSMAQTALVQAESADITETANVKTHEKEIHPGLNREGGDDTMVLTGMVSNKSEMTEEKNETEIAFVLNKLVELKESTGSMMRKSASFFLDRVEKGILTFTHGDLENGLRISSTQATNLVTHLKAKGLVENCADIKNNRKLYRLKADITPLTPQDYAPEIIEAVKYLNNSAKSNREKRIAGLLYACMPKGVITVADYGGNADETRLYEDMRLPENMRLVEKIKKGLYRINRSIPYGEPKLNGTQKVLLSTLYHHFCQKEFTRDDVAKKLNQSKSYLSSQLRLFTVLRLLQCREDLIYEYRLLVNPVDNPALFTTVKEKDTAGETYSKDFYEVLDTLAASMTSQRDKRLAESLRRSLDEGILRREYYDEQGYTQNMWEGDVSLAEQLGLIKKMSSDEYALNKEISLGKPNLLPHQKKAVTAIYEAFGDREFSTEMFIATLHYSESYSYASLHKLTILQILNLKTTDEGNQYKLIVNPEDHPEFFDTAA